MSKLAAVLLVLMPLAAVASPPTPAVTLTDCVISWNANPAAEQVGHYNAYWSADGGTTWAKGPDMNTTGPHACGDAGISGLGATHSGEALAAVTATNVVGESGKSASFPFVVVSSSPSPPTGISVGKSGP